MIETTSTLGKVGEILRVAGLLREFHGPEDLAVMGVCQDSRKIRPGDLFLAWQGDSLDAHDFVAAAVFNGAVAAVVERKVDIEVPQIIVTDGRRSAALAAREVIGTGSRRMFTVGVTGTNGKTTTALLARYLMGQKGPTAAIGTLGVFDEQGVRPGTEGLTTPGPVQVAAFLRQLVDGEMEAVVMEVSSHALDQHRIDGVIFDVGVFTNLSHDHLDYHGDIAEYFEAKARLVELVASQGTLVINADDEAWSKLDANGRSIRTFALNTPADVHAESVQMGPNGSDFMLVIDGERREVRLPLLARFNIENALAAAAVGAVYGLSIDEIASGLSTAPQVAGRLETVATEPFTVLIDFAHTPAALESVLEALRPLTTPGQLIVVFGAGGDRDRMKRRPMAAAVARGADVVVLTSDNPRTEDPEQILDDLVEGLKGKDHERVVDRNDAIRFALSTAQEGDTLLLAGKGHETYQVVGDEQRPFDERAIVRDCLAELGVS
ncbi:MAG TPA: UDP-N-acetylmuramoyl-L-alanyl-D-glutamate--2,6-diaminopimelate ligase [Gemmatimonadetes bacterium]|nr:UDP-N-acetylmuramoyl-L-alanyl-D-glutamate--2,6-diaminopimelate ligase [Gemmatimonadota bacterium]